jgi:cytochrome P450
LVTLHLEISEHGCIEGGDFRETSLPALKWMKVIGSYPRISMAPGPGTLAFILNLRNFRRDPLQQFWQAAMKYGDIVRYRTLWTTYQLSHPDHIQHVLQANFSNYRKGRDYGILRLSLGNGLLTSEGALWERQRKMTQPAFQSLQVAAFTRIMAAHTSALLARWEAFAARGHVFDVVPELMVLTLGIVSEALFTTNLESDTPTIQETLIVGREYSVNRAWSVIRLPLAVPTRRNRQYRKSIGDFHSIIDRLVSERRGAPLPAADLLTILMQARDEDGESMSNRQLRDEVATLLTAGHETTTLVLAWACLLIANRPEIVARIAAEVAFLNGNAPTYEDLGKLRYTRAVVEEVMRLYPPVWVLSRTAVEADSIGGHRIGAGSEILIFPYITHRHPKWWTDPGSFCPERFAPDRSSSRPRFAYLPFGAGPRTCVGLNFAVTEILVVLAMLLARFRVELAIDPAAVQAEPSVTLRPNPGVFIKLRSV